MTNKWVVWGGVCGVAAVPLLWSQTAPTAREPALVLGLFCWAAIGVAWVITLAVRRDPAHLIAPLVAAATLGVMGTDLPLQAGFALSRSALEEARASGKPGGAGIFEVDWVGDMGDGITSLELAGMGGTWYAEAGFLYAPQGVVEGKAVGEYFEFGHLGGGWYWYRVPESLL
ncbi:hypothetical protein [Actinocorallia sp. A-T 12471]|uniref:hypothetical protein n=1 Tax=Actinocorallia sp. A-T 12471 TaxID=3089813 RepID=UPI0029D2BA1B|nr:hypothetical protein [Actinocorallia sp. A-T 12471]MDX6739882.1 hypothetical protein [Actinocorallia sp. A-T 12471]